MKTKHLFFLLATFTLASCSQTPTPTSPKDELIDVVLGGSVHAQVKFDSRCQLNEKSLHSI